MNTDKIEAIQLLSGEGGLYISKTVNTYAAIAETVNPVRGVINVYQEGNDVFPISGCPIEIQPFFMYENNSGEPIIGIKKISDEEFIKGIMYQYFKVEVFTKVDLNISFKILNSGYLMMELYVKKYSPTYHLLVEAINPLIMLRSGDHNYYVGDVMSFSHNELNLPRVKIDVTVTVKENDENVTYTITPTEVLKEMREISNANRSHELSNKFVLRGSIRSLFCQAVERLLVKDGMNPKHFAYTQVIPMQVPVTGGFEDSKDPIKILAYTAIQMKSIPEGVFKNNGQHNIAFSVRGFKG